MTHPFVSCSKCLAEISADRKACPHCGTAIPVASDVAKLRAENARLKASAAAEEKTLREENAALLAKLTPKPASAMITKSVVVGGGSQ